MIDETIISIAGDHLGFSAAHFLVDMDKCERMHGHSYGVTVSVGGTLGPDETVIDFHRLRPIVETLCNELDHRILIAGDSRLHQLHRAEGEVEISFKEKRFILPESDCVILPLSATTVERMTNWMCQQLAQRLAGTAPGLVWVEIVLSEGPAQTACCRRNITTIA